MEGVYDACEEGCAPIVFHPVPTFAGAASATRDRFAAVAAARPGLRMVLAHLGGGGVALDAGIRRRVPALMFDLSEIVMWIGASAGPSAEDSRRA